jgi:hypothetical protein
MESNRKMGRPRRDTVAVTLRIPSQALLDLKRLASRMSAERETELRHTDLIRSAIGHAYSIDCRNDSAC